jgi:hypothetical protein
LIGSASSDDGAGVPQALKSAAPATARSRTAATATAAAKATESVKSSSSSSSLPSSSCEWIDRRQTWSVTGKQYAKPSPAGGVVARRAARGAGGLSGPGGGSVGGYDGQHGGRILQSTMK